jgi:hypothetical protein
MLMVFYTVKIVYIFVFMTSSTPYYLCDTRIYIMYVCMYVCMYARLDFHEFVHRDTSMKITNKMHYID